MKRILLWFSFLLVFIEVRAQSDYFIFIQQRSYKPFYLRMEDQSYSSSALGHIVLPKLKDSIYGLFVGSPGGKTEQFFTIDMFGKNRGFVWDNDRLTDLQNGLVLKSAGREDYVLTGPKKSDSYSLLMAGVVHDTAVLYETSVTMEVQPIPDSLPVDTINVNTANDSDKADLSTDQVETDHIKEAEHKKDTIAEKQQMREHENEPQKVQDIVMPPILPIRDPLDIIRYSTENLAEGKLMIFFDRSTTVTDTIRLIIPRL